MFCFFENNHYNNYVFLGFIISLRKSKRTFVRICRDRRSWVFGSDSALATDAHGASSDGEFVRVHDPSQSGDSAGPEHRPDMGDIAVSGHARDHRVKYLTRSQIPHTESNTSHGVKYLTRSQIPHTESNTSHGVKYLTRSQIPHMYRNLTCISMCKRTSIQQFYSSA